MDADEFWLEVTTEDGVDVVFLGALPLGEELDAGPGVRRYGLLFELRYGNGYTLYPVQVLARHNEESGYLETLEELSLP